MNIVYKKVNMPPVHTGYAPVILTKETMESHRRQVLLRMEEKGLDALLAGSRGAAHPAAEDVAPAGHLALVLGTAAAGMLAMGAAVFLWGRKSIRTDRAKPVE